MKRLFHWLSLVALSIPLLANAVEIAGVKIDDTITLENTSLKLNGAGIRYKAIFKVYVGALYTSKKVSSLDEIIQAPGPKRVSLTFLRDVDGYSFGKLITQGVSDNTNKSEMSKIIPGLIRLSEMFSANKSIATGDVITVDWIPNSGTVVYVRGKQQGEAIKDPDFFRALMSLWFGRVPADFNLKDAMLGLK